jgi:5-methylcytosine-specific restriction enzyme A
VTATNWPYNTVRWRKLCDYVLKNHAVYLEDGTPVYGMCVYCWEVGRATPLGVKKGDHAVDHVIPVRDRPDLAFDSSNCQPLCETCHNSVKRKFEATGHRAGTRADGSPVDPGHFWNE